ncbi:MAG: hypothetical protein GEV12_20035 [Micromonosporaceae bacterium]|nr:hypothetical protein [Micromonosporaceae bacterium]
MADDVEQRLAAAAEAVREHELTSRRCGELQERMDELATELAGLREQHAAEDRDVARLEGLSLTRVLAGLGGARDDALARERAEADAASYRVAAAQARLDVLHREHAAARARLDQLSTAPAGYAAALDAKERRLGESGDQRGRRLLELADERGRLTSELREVDEAVRATAAAGAALATLAGKLDSASGWSTYDTFLGGGVISSAVKHSRLDDAAAAAGQADRCLAVLRTELADVGGVALTAPQLAVDGTTRFVDVWFDNFFTDLTVRDRIKRAQQNVARSVQLVDGVRARLRQRAERAGDRLAAIGQERHDLLTRQP